MGTPLDSYLTVEEVASRYQVPAKSVVRMIRKQRLVAEKKGWMWLLPVDELPEAWPPPTHNGKH
jgi:excisionase family DNA binding protein